MNEIRRAVLQVMGAAGPLIVGAAAGLLKLSDAWSASWNKQAFESKALADALKSIGAGNLIESRDISITAPDIAENGAVVPITITSKIANTQSIALIAEKNPFPLVATLDVANGAEPYASLRIKLGQTSNVRAVVKADGKFHTAAREVKVTAGGCG